MFERFRSPAYRAAALLLAVVPAAPVSAASPDAKAAVRAAVEVLAAERHGVVLYQRHYDYDEHGPGHHKTIVVDEARIRVDGKLAAIHLYRQITNGQPAGAQELAKIQAGYDAQLPPEDYVLPLAEDGFSDYRYDDAVCTDCPAGAAAYAFTSLVRDPSHGDGTLVVDTASHRFVRIAFHPSALPKDADFGEVSMTFGRVLPDLTDVVEIRQRYTGHVLFMHGGADIVETETRYQRFATLAQARAAAASEGPQ